MSRESPTKDPGHTPPRRLNRTEYRYTVEDLFDIDFHPVALPPDQVARDGFDNVAITLSTQPALIEKYIALANQIIDKVWADESARKRLIFAHPPGIRKFDRTLPYIASKAESKETDMGDGSFTVAVKFKTTEGGTLFSKSPKDGEWVPDAKAFFLADGHKHASKQLPAMIAGKAGGKLKTGRHLVYQNGQAESVYLSMLDVMGVKVEQMGGTKTALRIG